MRRAGAGFGIGRWTLLLTFLLLLCSSSRAADLTLAPLSQDLRLRAGAPIPLEVEMTNHTARLIEGRVEAVLLQRDQPASVVRSQEVFLSSGRRAVPLLLPPPSGSGPGEGLSVRLRFAGKDGVIELGEHRLGFVLDETEFVLAIVRTERRLAELDTARERSLRLESLRPQGAVFANCTTHAVSLPAAAMPLHAIGWCAYDAVCLDGSAFAATNERQLASLTRWIAGGGSAVIFPNTPGTERLARRHVAFLRGLGAGTIALSDDGKLTGDVPRRIPHGLGRALVVAAVEGTAKAFDAKPWRADVAWLWKMRADEVERVAADGSWSKRKSRDYEAQQEEFEFDRWLHGAAMGYDVATPDKPRPLPLLLVSLLLGGLLLAAGPVDWCVLGWLRRRRWTWIAFPLLCVAATWLAAHLSSRYLGHLDRRGALRITDIGADGTVLREVRYDLLLPAKDGQWSVDARDGVVVKTQRAYDPADFIPGAIQPPSQFGLSILDDGAAEGEWSAPGHFTLRRTVRQWSPVMNRTVRFPGTPDDSGIDWQRIASVWKGAAPLQAQTLPNYDTDGWHVMFGTADTTVGVGTVVAPNNPDDGHVSTTRVRVHGEISEGSRMNYQVVRRLMDKPNATALDAYLAAHSPVLDGAGATRATAPAPLTALVWRETEHEIHIHRRQFAAGEISR
jgi:hypothetical protein